MGNLHEGHRALIRRSRDENDIEVVSIFVNPIQFGPREDFKKYPRTMAQDERMLEKEQVDVLFAPSSDEMLPAGFSTVVEVPSLAAVLCGPFRPGHFRGVATIVAKLFAVVQPSRAYFGEKDYQQLRMIVRM